MPIDWKSSEALERFLVSWWIVGPKPDLKKVAEAYGRGATYHTMEGFSRKLKAKAEVRIKEMEAGKESGGDTSPTPVKTRTPKKPKANADGVVSGRVQKNNSPTRRTLQRSSTFVKSEASQASSNGALQTPALTPGSMSDAVDLAFDEDFSRSFDIGAVDMAGMLGAGHDQSFHSFETDSF